MKKRCISLLLTLVMVFSFVATMNVTAFADSSINISEYATLETVAKGQTLIGICQKLKINFDDVKNGIMVANDFNSQNQLSSLYVGEKIWIPTSKANSNTIVKNAYAFDENGKATKRSNGGGVTTVEVDIPTEDVQTYTIAKGDTIGKICKAKGLDYDVCKEAIVKLNPKRFSSIASLGKIQPNWVIYLPVSNSAANSVAKIIETAEKEISGGGSSSSIGGDVLWGYVVKHTMASGETIKSVCNALGKSYSTETSNMVKTMNNIKNLNNVKAGTTYWFPANYSNGTGYAIYSHTVVAGDTCGKLCSARGVSYNNVSSILQALNPGTNLNNIKRGQTLLIVGGKSGDAGNGGINIVIGGKFTITCSAATGGTVKASASSADKGTLITITATPNADYKAGNITVTNTSTGAEVTATAKSAGVWTFTMPDSHVKVDVTFVSKGTLHKLVDKTPSTAGSLKFLVNGKEGTQAYVGDAITIVPTSKNKSNEYANATYSYTKGGTTYSKEVGGKTFTMPDSDATVIATFAGSVKLSFTSPAALYGTMTVSCNGSNISAGSKVPKGSGIAVKIDTVAGYALTGNQITYTYNDGSLQTKTVSPGADGLFYFTMPGYDTTIKPLAFNNDVYSITAPGLSYCTAAITLDGNTVSSISKALASTAKVKVKLAASPNYAVDVSTFEATKCTATFEGDNTWTLTNFTGDVEIKAIAKAAYQLKSTVHDNCTVKITANGKDISCVDEAAKNTTVVIVTPVPDSGYSIDGTTFKVTAGSCTVKNNGDGSWTLTNFTGNVDIEVKAKAAFTISNVCSPNAVVSDIKVDEVSTTTACQGALVTFKMKVADGYTVAPSNIKILNESNAELGTATSLGDGKYKFTMYGENVKISTQTMVVKDISGGIGWHKYSLDLTINGAPASLGQEIKKNDVVVMKFTIPHTVNTANDNVLKNYPVFAGGTVTKSSSTDANNEYYTFEIKAAGDANVTYKIDNAWT